MIGKAEKFDVHKFGFDPARRAIQVAISALDLPEFLEDVHPLQPSRLSVDGYRQEREARDDSPVPDARFYIGSPPHDAWIWG